MILAGAGRVDPVDDFLLVPVVILAGGWPQRAWVLGWGRWPLESGWRLGVAGSTGIWPAQPSTMIAVARLTVFSMAALESPAR
jgi:hypothetical protein